MLHNQSGPEETEALGADALEMAEPEAAETTSAGADAQANTPEPADAEPVAEPAAEEATVTAEAEPVAEPAAEEATVTAEAEPETPAEPEPAQAEVEPVSEPAEPAPASVEKKAEPPSPAPQPEPETGLKRGELVEATILDTSPTAIKVQLGEHGEGTIPSGELERMGRKALEALKVGAPLTVYIVNPHAKEGGALVSINRAEEELDWQRANNFKNSQEVYDTKIAGYNKGGLIVKFGHLRGFVPQSQMNAERRRMDEAETPETRWGKMVNEPIVVKVMEVDKSRNRLILSERSAARESREKRKETLINQLAVGETRTGRVVSLEDFGAFIDIGGAEGLIHLTELSWHHVTHPRQFLEIGQEIDVRVISIDPEAKRIGLSLKALEMDPWDRVATEYNSGQLVRAKVTKLTKFGAFAEIEGLPEIEGLIHISELSDRRVTHPKEVVNEGDELTLRIVKMDIENRRLGLSLKKVNSPEYLDSDWDTE
ncbi:MAG TPA: S1 RNA-binding domain-containing protein [Candidatus Limnocylindrales bacterium]|nr:S1 RNA-binding domain-containing protein [Candidatus Limnocylindrales bacterium]